MKRIVGVLLLVAAVAVFAIPSNRVVAIEYARIAMNASMAVFDSARTMANNDLNACNSSDPAERRECLKRHEAPLDRMDSRLDTAGQQDKLYKAME